MEQDFLNAVARDLVRRKGNDMSRTVVIFPNKRASLFLNDFIAQHAQLPIWAPRYLSVSEFFESLSDKSIADPIDTICRLYRHYVRLTGSSETLDFFYGWAEQLLADFDDADKQMADAEKLFRDVRDYAQLESYDFLTDEQKEQLRKFADDFAEGKMTRLRKNFDHLWNVLFSLYTDLRAELAADGLAYEGQLFREVAEGLRDGRIALPAHIDCIAVVGFNAIDRVEQTLFAELQKAGKALFYWDYDTWYMETKENGETAREAGLFLKENLKNFPNALQGSYAYDNLMSQREARSLEFASAPTEAIQAQSVKAWLEDSRNFNPQHPRRTAIVLCNENLLQPVLQALPSGLGPINVTKGFPFTHTQAYTCVAKMVEETERETDRRAATSQRVSSEDSTPEMRRKRALTFIDALTARLEEEARAVTLKDQTDELLRVLNTEAYFQATAVCRRFHRLLTEGCLDVKLHTLCRLMRQVMRTVSIPFHGEPAVGLQVMGVLETRCLDFDNVLMLSVNEGVLPQKSSESSFIPFLIRKMHRLTTADRRVAVYSYYFYRLLQRAARVRLVYNNSTEGMQRGEMSRFMRALLVEENAQMHIQQLRLTTKPQPLKLTPIIGKRRPEQKGIRRFSPSALKAYFKCPLKFYYHYHEHLRTPQAQDPIINTNDFGTVFHEAIDQLFSHELRESRESLITPASIHHFLQSQKGVRVQELVMQAFKNNGIEHSLITQHAVQKYLLKLLHYEAGDFRNTEGMANYIAGFENEKKVSHIFQVPCGNRTVDVELYGSIDRYDTAQLTDGLTYQRVIDYKTGKPQKFNLTMSDFFEPNYNFPENQFQVFVYSLIMSKQTEAPIMPMLYFVPSLSSYSFSPFVTVDKEVVRNFHTIAAEFEERLIKALAKIIDSEAEFVSILKDNNCQYCDYKRLCGQ